MTDLIGRLRASATQARAIDRAELLHEAADEIQSLRLAYAGFDAAPTAPAGPLTDAYLAKAEKDARRFQGAWTGTSGTLAAHVMRLLGEIRRLRSVPQVPFPLVEAINRQTIAMLAGKSPATDRSVYAEQDPYSQNFKRNKSCWINSASNVTCFSPAQLSGTPWNQRAGTLITRRHVVYANHFGIPIIENGTPILFVDKNGWAVQRRVVAQASDAASDIAIGLLDEEVSDNISIAPVLPPGFEVHLGERSKILAVTLDSEEKANVQQCNTFFIKDFSVNTLDAPYVSDEYRKFAPWSEPTVVGDSGNPAFLFIYGELVLLGCFWTAMGGPHVGARHEQVNSMIEGLSPGLGYRLTHKML